MTNEEALRRHFDAANARDWASAMDGYDEHVVLIPDPEGSLDIAPRFGRDAVGAFFGDWMRTFAGGVHFGELRIESGTDALAVEAAHTARGAGSGLELDRDMFYAYWFRRGKIIRVEMFSSMDDARDAAGVQGPDLPT